METLVEHGIDLPLTQRPSWKELENHSEKVRKQHLRSLFPADPERGRHMSAEGVGLYFDYSKNRMTDQTLRLLLQLAEECCSGWSRRT
jgi:glucose-6-phosphate isomerase